MTSSPWKNVTASLEGTVNFADIMSEEYAHRLHDQEVQRYEKRLSKVASKSAAGRKSSYSETVAAIEESPTVAVGAEETGDEWEDYSALLSEPASVDGAIAPEFLTQEATVAVCDSDAVIAQMLQTQFDREYNEELRRIEQQQNKQSKVTVTLSKFRREADDEADDFYEEEDEDAYNKRDWDRFETNEKIFETIPKRGFKVDQEGEMITKHDEKLCGVRNACRVMSFPPEFATGDGAGFDMKLSNRVFNQLKTYSRRGNGKKSKMHDRKENEATAEMGMDGPTRMLLYKLINNQILEQINGIVCTGKESVILHANSDPAYVGADAKGQGTADVFMAPKIMPKECAIKIFKTTLNEFKQRDRYIKDDYRFKDRFSKQNNRVIINMWAEKEMQNIIRMQSVGINCPEVVALKKHVLVMSFIGENHKAAPKLKDAHLTEAELSMAYEEIVLGMHKLFNEARLVHADLSEYNILWHDNKCWFIDVAQSVVPEHPSALEFLMRDCRNVVNFFTKRGLSNIYTKEQLFEHITELNAENHNAALLERIHTRGASLQQATAPNPECCPDELKPLSYPFEAAWEKSVMDRRKDIRIDEAAKALEVLCVAGDVELSSYPELAAKTNSAKH